jgi:hypothetical protein
MEKTVVFDYQCESRDLTEILGFKAFHSITGECTFHQNHEIAGPLMDLEKESDSMARWCNNQPG